MDFRFSQNRVDISLKQDEKIFLRGRALRGVKEFNWLFFPPFPLGSPIIRVFYGSYFLMREMGGMADRKTFSINGTNARGNFHAVQLEPGERYYVSGRNLAGFSSDIRSLHTHIKFQMQFWFLEKHFFPVFEGPGYVLIYGKSAFETTEALSFQPERIVAFNVDRSFRVAAPQPSRLTSQIINLFSREVVWEFLDEGRTVVEAHNPDVDEDDEGNALWNMVKHILGFIKF